MVTIDGFDASAWGRPVGGSCFSYDNADPVVRAQAGLRIDNLSQDELSDLRVSFFSGKRLLPTCFHGYGGALPSIAAGDGRNITFFTFVDRDQAVTEVVVQALGQSRRFCVAGQNLVPCR